MSCDGPVRSMMYDDYRFGLAIEDALKDAVAFLQLAT